MNFTKCIFHKKTSKSPNITGIIEDCYHIYLIFFFICLLYPLQNHWAVRDGVVKFW